MLNDLLLLLRAGVPAKRLTPAGATDTVYDVEGWRITIFVDAGDFDYIDSVSFPPRMHGSFNNAPEPFDYNELYPRYGCGMSEEVKELEDFFFRWIKDYNAPEIIQQDPVPEQPLTEEQLARLAELSAVVTEAGDVLSAGLWGEGES